jgi:hypothetical protein
LQLDAPYFLAAFGGFVPGLAWSFAGRPGVVAVAAIFTYVSCHLAAPPNNFTLTKLGLLFVTYLVVDGMGGAE